MTEEALKAYTILWGVEAVGPALGTTIPILKGWMRGDNALPPSVWEAWVAYSSLPEAQRPPMPGTTVNPNVLSASKDAAPAVMSQSSLASRILADPAVAARIKAETAPKAEAAREAALKLVLPAKIDKETFIQMEAPVMGRNLAPVNFDEEIPVSAPKANGAGAPKLGTIAFCCPTDRDFPPVVMEAFSVLIRNHQMPLILKAETLLVRARNLIAERFLRTKCEWSFWADSDMLLPIGSAEWFKDKSKIHNLRPEQYGFDVLKRLLSHRSDFVGAVYAARTEDTQMIIQCDIDPRTPADTLLAEQIRKNQAHGLKETLWLGFGACLVHRRVFEAISRTDPEIRQGKGSFFDTAGAKGEDIRFSERAIAAGFRPKLDSELVCGHLGRQCFKPENTRGRSKPNEALKP